jgi:hypothetical protein
MVRYDIHNNLQATLVTLLDIALEELVATVARINAVVVATRVAVVRRTILVVEQEGCRPYSRSTEIGDIVEVIDHTLKVTTVATTRLRAVGLLYGVVSAIVARIAIGKAVGHNEVYEVGCGEALTLA